MVRAAGRGGAPALRGKPLIIPAAVLGWGCVGGGCQAPRRAAPALRAARARRRLHRNSRAGGGFHPRLPSACFTGRRRDTFAQAAPRPPQRVTSGWPHTAQLPPTGTLFANACGFWASVLL
jgi:hypothetical protein